MFKYYFKIFLRNIKRDKSSFAINIIGLSSGLACFFLIYLWATDELSFDKFHENKSRLYQVMLLDIDETGSEVFEDTPGLLAKALKEEMPEIEYAVSVIPSNWFDSEGIISVDNKKLKVKEQYVGKDYFKIFSYNTIQGSSDRLYSGTKNVLISDKIAQQLFSVNDNIIGKTIDWERKRFENNFTDKYEIVGVFESPPENSTEQFDIVFSYDLFYQKMQNNLANWDNSNPYTFLTLHAGTNSKAFNEKIKRFLKTKSESSDDNLLLRPYADRYLYNSYKNGVIQGGRIVYVRLFSTIGFFILLIACINYVNLSTAQATKRLKEVGIKKSIGARRKNLIAQFLSESIFLAFFSFIIAIGIILILLPQFNGLTGKNLNLNSGEILVLMIFAIITGVFSGSYPAFYISKFKPIQILKGKFPKSVGESFTRKGLVIFQFCISVILIVSVWGIYKQLELLQTKNLGYNNSNVICFKSEGEIEKNINSFLNEVKKIPGVVNATNSAHNLTNDYGRTTSITYNEWNLNRENSLANMSVNFDFFETLGVQIKEGRSFSHELTNETSKLIFNESAIKLMGINNPIGKYVKYGGRDVEIIGVVRDFNFESLYNDIKPSFYRLMPSDNNYGENIFVKVNSGDVKSTISNIQGLYTKFNAGLSLEFSFLDNDYQKLYDAERRISILSKYFASLAIIISCLGLFGLSTYTIRNRTKEIGIRKVHGSTAFNIVNLLTASFTRLVFISLIISLPLSFLIIKIWLNNFAYRIDLNLWMFLTTGFLTLIIAWITVGMQSLKAANMNPAVSLKDE